MVTPGGSVLLIGAILALAACQASEEPSGLSTGGLTLANSDKVWICHFRGHERNDEGIITHDYVTTEPFGGLSTCRGNVIEVSSEACVNGHAALPRSGMDCNTTH